MRPRTADRHPLPHNRHLRLIPRDLSPASARPLLIVSLLLDPIILSQPLHPALHQWSTTALVLLFVMSLKADQPSRLSPLARSIVRKRLAILSSPRVVELFLGLVGATIIAEAALVLGRAAAPLLILGAVLGIPGALAIVRAFRSQFILIRKKLEDETNFESSVQRTTALFINGALVCSRLCGFFTAVSLVPLMGVPLASTLGIICSLCLLLSAATDRCSDRSRSKRS